MALDYVALVILIVVLLLVVYGLIAIWGLPYEIAKKRNHPHQDAIGAAIWVSLFTLGVLWPFLLGHGPRRRNRLRCRIGKPRCGARTATPAAEVTPWPPCFCSAMRPFALRSSRSCACLSTNGPSPLRALAAS